MTDQEHIDLLQKMDGLNDTVFAKYLQECLDRHMLESIQARDEVQLRWSQAKAQFALDLLQDIRTAREKLHKLKSPGRPDPRKAF